MYFSFSVIFSFLAIFQVLQCAFLVFHVFQWFRHFSSPQVDVSQIPWFSVFCHIPRPPVDISKFSTFFSFLTIFHVLKSVFLIFLDFQFSRHIPGPSVCISHFSRFLVISSFFKSSIGCFSFPWFSVFLPYSTSYSEHFYIFHLYQFSSPYFTS